jgi:glycosyltransferase involved in cell wall biosynthesis
MGGTAAGAALRREQPTEMARAGSIASGVLKEPFMSELPGVSIVIGNYNYAQFVALAIESALAQDHPRCEVIVVDDGSTDGSQEVVERYRDRARIILLPSNRGQVPSRNEAWPMAKYGILIFLDSDDLLEPHAASTIARNWRADVVKVQFPMKSIDTNGKSLNQIYPKYPPNLRTDTLRHTLLRYGACHATPGSGNAYAKCLLEKLSPISGLPHMDWILRIRAPFYGEVLTLSAPLASYRIHDTQWSRYNHLSLERLIHSLELEETNLSYVSAFFKEIGLTFDPEFARMTSQWQCECLISISRLSGPEGRWYVPPIKVVGLAFKAFLWSPYSLKRRSALLVWTMLVAFAPRRSAKRLMELRFSKSKRPKWITRVVSGLVL